MRTLAVPTCALVAVMLASAGAQTPPTPPDEQYLFIDTLSASSKWLGSINFSKLGERLADAGNRGYLLHWMARRSPSMILRRDGQGPRSYRLVAEGGEGSFLKELNLAGSQGFTLLPDTTRVFERQADTTWVGVMTKDPDAATFTYSVVKGTQDGERALAESTANGRVLKAILGRQGWNSANTLLLFEEAEHRNVPSTAPGRLEYRIVATARTSAMQNDLVRAAAEHFRVSGAGTGYMTAVMARDPASAAEPVDYRLVAMIRVETAVKELSAAGAEGFKIAGSSQNGPEAVFILERQPGTPERFEYQILTLREATADRLLRESEAEGYRIAVLFNDLVVLERP